MGQLSLATIPRPTVRTQPSMKATHLKSDNSISSSSISSSIISIISISIINSSSLQPLEAAILTNSTLNSSITTDTTTDQQNIIMSVLLRSSFTNALQTPPLSTLCQISSKLNI